MFPEAGGLQVLLNAQVSTPGGTEGCLDNEEGRVVDADGWKRVARIFGSSSAFFFLCSAGGHNPRKRAPKPLRSTTKEEPGALPTERGTPHGTPVRPTCLQLNISALFLSRRTKTLADRSRVCGTARTIREHSCIGSLYPSSILCPLQVEIRLCDNLVSFALNLI